MQKLKDAGQGESAKAKELQAELEDASAEQEAAVVRIQAIQRGKAARAEVQKLKDAGQGEGTKAKELQAEVEAASAEQEAAVVRISHIHLHS